MKTSEQAQPELGRREKNKMETRRRIRTAARKLFSKHGYETATLRKIAKHAHVGLGTVFNYAVDKRDLIFLIFNEQLAALAMESSQTVQSTQPMVEQLMSILGPHYKFFAGDPTLSRILLKDMEFFSEGRQATEFHNTRAHLLAGLKNIVSNAQRRGEIRSDEDPVFISRHICILFGGHLRSWIDCPNPKWRDGLTELRRIFRLQMDGLKPTRRNSLKDSSRLHRNASSGPRSENLSPQGAETLLLSRRANSKSRL